MDQWIGTEKGQSKHNTLGLLVYLCLRDRKRNSIISGELGLETLFLFIEKSQLRWFSHLPLEVFWAFSTGSGPRGEPLRHMRNYVFSLTWEYLGISWGKFESVAEERDFRVSRKALLPLRPNHKEMVEKGLEVPKWIFLNGTTAFLYGQSKHNFLPTMSACPLII